MGSMRVQGIFCLCVALAAAAIGEAAGAASHEFERLSLREGLSQSIIEGIAQDKKGFLWFVTEDGLNRFDGYKFQVIRNKAGSANSLSHNELKSILEDRSGTLWIGTFEGGLNRYDPSTATFTRYRNDPADAGSLSANTVRSLLEDRSGTVWIGTQGGGLDEFDPRTQKFIHHRTAQGAAGTLTNDVRVLLQDSSGTLWAGTNGGGLCRYDLRTRTFTSLRHSPSDPDSLSSDSVTALLEDSDQNLWIGTTGGGLDRLDRTTGRFTHTPLARAGDLGPVGNSIRALLQDHEGQLWIGTDGGGLFRLDPKTGVLSHSWHDPSDPRSISADKVLCLFQDRSRVLWVGTYGGGLNKVDIARKRFQHVRNEPGNPNSLSHNIVWSILEDKDGAVWVGTDSGGLNRWDRRAGTFRHFRHDPANPSSLAADAVRVVFGDRIGILWLGTHGAGLDRLDPASGRITHYRHDPADPASLSHDELRAVYEDRAGNLWIGTLGGGLDRLDRETGRFLHYRHDPANPRSLSNDFVRAILEDSSGTYWIGTQGGGLNRFDPATGDFKAFRADPNDPQSLSNDYVFALYEDSKRSLWIATYGGGLNRLDRPSGRFERFTEKDGLASSSVYGILEDEAGRLWLSTNNGLSCFDPKAKSFKSYDARDGLQSNEFNGGSFYRSPSGEMFFGGINGFNVFLPSQILVNPDAPPVVITDLQLFNKSVAAGESVDGRVLLTRPIEYTDRLQLSYRENVVTFEFAALHFAAPEKNRYSYRLEGFGEAWILARADRRSATFTGLSPGSYLFRVKGANADGVWNETGAAIRLVILPPVWATWWFRLLAGLSATALLYVAVRHRVHNERLRAALKAAHDAQMALLPQEAPKIDGFDIAGVCLPAAEVGGDFFDYIPLDGDRFPLAIAVGDVSGKGTRAAMAAAVSSGMVNAHAGSAVSPATIMTRLNGTIRHKVQKQMFTALCLTSLEARGRGISFVNAGLCEPLMKKGNEVTYLASEGPTFPLGSLAGTQYQSRNVPLSPGDVVVLYTDGVPEAPGPDGEPWGYDALAAFLSALRTSGLSAAAIAEALIQEVRRVSRHEDQRDDIAVVIVKVVEPADPQG
jgi:ligand-binding sensor domain-containing protein